MNNVIETSTGFSETAIVFAWIIAIIMAMVGLPMTDPSYLSLARRAVGDGPDESV